MEFNEYNSTGDDCINTLGVNKNEFHNRNSKSSGFIENKFNNYNYTGIYSTPTGNVLSASLNQNISSPVLTSTLHETHSNHLVPVNYDNIYHYTDHLTNIDVNENVFANNPNPSMEVNQMPSSSEIQMKEKVKNEREQNGDENIDDKDGLLALEGLLSLSKY